MKKFINLFLILVLFSVQIFAKISFGVSDINSDDEVLFTVNQNTTGINSYKSLFSAKIIDGQSSNVPWLVTCYPEKMELLENDSILQIRNRYGTGHYFTNTNTFKCVETKSALPLNSFPISSYSVSPNGKYFCYIEKTSTGSGNLILEEVATNKKTILSEKARNSFKEVPVKWALDSSIFIYEKDNQLLFGNPDAILRGIEMEEKFRKIGRGSIESINWASARTIIYIDDYLVYQINSKELYTLGLYAGILGQGKVIGRLPYQFNSGKDKFSVNSSVTSMVLVQNGRLFSYLKFQNNSCDYLDVVYSRPYADSSASLLESEIFWDYNNDPVLWLKELTYENLEKAVIYKLSEKADKVLEIENPGEPSVSPDRKKIAFGNGDSFQIYDLLSFNNIENLSGEKIISILWASNSIVYVGGHKTIKKLNLEKKSKDIIALSSAQAGYWDKTNNSIIVENDTNQFYSYNKEKAVWTNVEIAQPEGSLQNANYRLFCGSASNAKFENGLFIRTLKKSAVTKPMYPECNIKTGDSKKVALVFDAYDNADGLSAILSALKKYNIPASFFVNGEFIKRYPSETKQIASTNFTVGSMFFSQTDLVNNPFIVDESFIRRGLARNEDAYYECTGKELSLFWHGPYYSVSPKIISWGESAGYQYVNSLHAINDSEKLEKDTKPETIIQKYCDSLRKTSGGIVPVSVGFSQGARTNPLYDYLDLLVCTLFDLGYEFVNVEYFND